MVVKFSFCIGRLGIMMFRSLVVIVIIGFIRFCVVIVGVESIIRL